MAAKHYRYATASNSSHGEMRCYVCGKFIEAGAYRYHETPNAYVTAHRACTESDPEWEKIDSRNAASEKWRRGLSEACVEFRSKWGVTELDCYIIEATGATHEH